MVHLFSLDYICYNHAKSSTRSDYPFHQLEISIQTRYALGSLVYTRCCKFVQQINTKTSVLIFKDRLYYISRFWYGSSRLVSLISTNNSLHLQTTFVSSAACQSLNIPSNDFNLTLRCNATNIPRQLYFWISLLGYIVAYFLMTIFLTSYERVPTKNEIAYKSISVAFIKNMGKVPTWPKKAKKNTHDDD